MVRIYNLTGHFVAVLLVVLNRQVLIRKNRQKISNQICMVSRPRSLAVTKISKISESPDIWVITILREPQRYIKFSTNFAVGIARIRVRTQWALTIVYGRREKVSAFSLFLFVHCQKLSKTRGYFAVKVTSKLYYYVTMGLAAGSVDL